MRKVLFRRWIPGIITKKGLITSFTDVKYELGTNCWSDFIHEGLFHQWANAYEEFENGPGNYTVALVEIQDGTIEEVLPSNILFIDRYKKESK